jgi:antitoxin PrlF
VGLTRIPPSLHFAKCNEDDHPVDSAITAKGQTTIPKAIRDHLGLSAGDRVKFFLHPDGSVVLLPKLPVSALRGIVKPRRNPVTIDEMAEAAAAGAAGDLTRDDQ